MVQMIAHKNRAPLLISTHVYRMLTCPSVVSLESKDFVSQSFDVCLLGV